MFETAFRDNVQSFSEVQEFTHSFETMTTPCHPPFRNCSVHISTNVHFQLWAQQVVGQPPFEDETEAALDPKPPHMWLTSENFSHQMWAILMSKSSSVMWSFQQFCLITLHGFFFFVCTSVSGKNRWVRQCAVFCTWSLIASSLWQSFLAQTFA